MSKMGKDFPHSFIHKSLKLETTQMSTSRWMDIQIVIFSYSKILISNKKEWTPDVYNNMDISQNIMLSKRHQAQKLLIV